jgi:hypothetical protein
MPTEITTPANEAAGASASAAATTRLRTARIEKNPVIILVLDLRRIVGVLRGRFAMRVSLFF